MNTFAIEVNLGTFGWGVRTKAPAASAADFQELREIREDVAYLDKFNQQWRIVEQNPDLTVTVHFTSPEIEKEEEVKAKKAQTTWEKHVADSKK